LNQSFIDQQRDNIFLVLTQFVTRLVTKSPGSISTALVIGSKDAIMNTFLAMAQIALVPFRGPEPPPGEKRFPKIEPATITLPMAGAIT